MLEKAYCRRTNLKIYSITEDSDSRAILQSVNNLEFELRESALESMTAKLRNPLCINNTGRVAIIDSRVL